MKRYLSAMGGLIIVLLLFPTLLTAQMENQPYVTVTTMHFDFSDEGNNYGTWKAAEQEYREKVINKNDLIRGTAVYTHLYTEDSREVVFVQVYDSWEDIEKAQERNGELAQESWPDEAERNAFFDKLNSHYSEWHSDQIYRMMPGAKYLAQPAEKDMVLYVRINYMAYPEDGSQEEFMEGYNWFIENMVNKNEIAKAYYPHIHAWGTDRREMVDAWLYDSMADVEKAGDRMEELWNEGLPEEAQRKAMGEKMGKYFLGHHKDMLYTYIHDLSKATMTQGTN
ncbi:hypothetical protein E7Z59_01740 [Robertkochia marina]|uniref:ABM domain-containing protein n=1 Tax=Robertkochia marina TaxID=1227945 RepID=A0A4S3M2Z8_9FLAO|nr:hypothetical protein [Robertkochia marina]THD69075.1 hypothetical protein E7Z59_01740 [Robertkochia marina]